MMSIISFKIWLSGKMTDQTYSGPWFFGVVFGVVWVLLMNSLIDYIQGKWGLH